MLRAEGAVNQERTNVSLCQANGMKLQDDKEQLQDELKSVKLQRWLAAGAGLLVGGGAVYFITR